MIYACALSAVQTTTGGRCGVKAAAIRVDTDCLPADIEDTALAMCRDEFPAHAGWVDHKVTVLAIPDDWGRHPEPVYGA
jgi:hypothetical protein